MKRKACESSMDCAVDIEDRTRLRMECGACDTVIVAAPGSRIITCDCTYVNRITTGLVKHQGLEALEIAGLRGRIEIPMCLSGNQFVPLLVAITGSWTGDLYVTQRRGDGQLSSGYGIHRPNS